MHDIVKLLEDFKTLDFDHIDYFANTTVTDNSMQHRSTLEDLSKIAYLVEETESKALMFHPQIIHEPWHNRYRIHPGSGRAIALWLCGYEQFKTIYTHFNEDIFTPPGHTIKHNNWKTFANEITFNVAHAMFPTIIDVETFHAFPRTESEEEKTREKDSVWCPPKNYTMHEWKFIVYSEGKNFLDYKRNWRAYAYSLYDELNHSIFQIGKTIFEFNGNKVVRVFRNNVAYNLLT